MTDSGGTSGEGCELSFGDMAAASRREALNTDRAVSVRFDDMVRAKLQAEADKRHQAMAGKDLAYGRTTQSGQFVGVLGEAGVLLWLHETMSSSIELWGDQPGGADIYVRNPADGKGLTLIEVKTHGADFWRDNGRLVNAKQLSRMPSDVILWCVAPEPVGRRVVLAGWSPVAEVRASGVPETTGQFANIRAHALLRAPEQLTAWLASGRTLEWPSAQL